MNPFLRMLGQCDKDNTLAVVAQWSERSQQHLAEEVLDFIADISVEVGDPEDDAGNSIKLTPIEHLMGLALYCELGQRRWPENGITVINQQHQIVTSKASYRVDFLLAGMLNSDKTADVVIECDGHDFHEKTKRQAQKDKSRDRDLQMNGYIVLRFTGSEIWKDPSGCAREAWGVYDQKLGLRRGRLCPNA